MSTRLEYQESPEPVAVDGQSFDIPALIGILRARWRIVAGTMATVLALTLVWFVFTQKTYNATAVMMLDQRRNTVADVNAVLSGIPTDTASMQNQLQIIASRKLAAQVVTKLGLDHDPEFSTSAGLFGVFGMRGALDAAGSRSGTPQFEATIDRVLKRLSVEQVGVSTTINLSIGSTNPEKSALLTNAWADAYLEDQMNSKFEATQQTATWLANRVRQLAPQVQADEIAVQAYKAEHGIVDTTAGGSIIDQQTANVSGQLITARADLAQKAALYGRVAELKRAGRAADASQVVASPLIGQLRIQEANLTGQEAELTARYLPQHPKMIDLRAQMRDVRGKIGIEVNRVVEGLANDVAVARANVASLEFSLKQLQSQFGQQNNASAKLKGLQSIAASSRSMYEALLSRLKEVQGQEGFAAPDTRIVSRAVAPTTASPKFSTVFGVAIPAGLALGLVLAFLMEGMDSSFRRGDQVERSVGLRVLAVVPEMKDGVEPQAAVVRRAGSSFTESIRGLNLSLMTMDAGTSPPKVILVTSAVGGEGKTVVAASLARLAAKTGRKVALVEADFRRPSLARAMNVSTAFGGIAQALKGDLPVERCMMTDELLPGVSVLACNEAVRDPSETLASGAMEALLANLKAKYDLVIVDAAPLLPVHDTWPLTRIADATLLLVHAGRTSREDVLAAVRALRTMHARVAGVALTRSAADPRGAYRDYIGDEADSSSKPHLLQFSIHPKTERRAQS